MAPTNGFTGLIINDGYTRSAYISPVEGIYDELKLTYRPCTTEERATHGDDIANDRLVAANKKAAALMGKHIKGWTIPGAKADAASMLRLNLNLFNRLYQIALGNDAGDEEPAIEPAEGGSPESKEPLPAAANEGANAGN